MRHSIVQKLIFSPYLLLTHLQIPQKNAIFTITNPFSSSTSHKETISNQKSDSYVASYLINSCGLTPSKAKSLSCKLKFDSPEKPDLMLAFLKEHGFTIAHIAKLVSWDPRRLNYKSPQKTLLPKFKFLYSIGVSKDCLADIICGCTPLIFRSLDNVVIPAYKLIRSVVSSDEQVVSILKRRPWLFLSKDKETFTLNVKFLRELGIPQAKIVYLMGLWLDALFLDQDEFCKCVSEVVDMGFDVSKMAFVWALCANSNEKGKEMIRRAFKVYEKWGWSKDDILSVYRRYPQCMFLSEDNIMKKMDFLVNKIGIKSRDIVKCPLIVGYSLERRIFPRCSVVWFLEKKGLLRKKLSLSHILGRSDKKFVEMFITKYNEDLPELLSVYQGKMDPFRG